MANTGKFVDRFPGINTAGIRFPTPSDGVAECLTFPVTIADVADALSHSLPKKTANNCLKDPPPNDVIYRHYNTNVKDILEADMKTGFEAFRAELRETAYKSYWRDEVGKIPDQVPNLPVGMDPENTTFGSPPPERTPAAELINPRKCRGLIKYEASVGHDLYCKSHNSYDPGEQKRVMDPPLADMVFGERSVTDHTGGHVKTLLQWIDQSVISMTSRSMADYKDLLYYPLGKGRVRTGVPAGITKDAVFGKPSTHGKQPVPKDRDKMLPILVSYLSRMKDAVKKNNLDLKLLLVLFSTADPDKTGRLHSSLVYHLSSRHGLNLNEDMMDPILIRLGYMNIQDSSISYKDLVNLLNFKQPLPDFGKSDTPSDTHYSTIYMDLCGDLSKKSQYDVMPKAGTPGFKADSLSISLPFGPGWCLANLEDIPMQTTVDDVLRPHIFTHYGLSIYDVFKPRSKEFIRELFIKKVGLEIPENIFEIIWEEGLRRDGVVSVETFKNILGEISTGKLEQMADTTIHQDE